MQVKAVIFDKTGTLTVGKPAVVNTMVFSNTPLLELCDLAAAAEVFFFINFWLRKFFQRLTTAFELCTYIFRFPIFNRLTVSTPLLRLLWNIRRNSMSSMGFTLIT